MSGPLSNNEKEQQQQNRHRGVRRAVVKSKRSRYRFERILESVCAYPTSEIFVVACFEGVKGEKGEEKGEKGEKGEPDARAKEK